MLTAICDLTVARPHLHITARLTPGELSAWIKGYYQGLVMALRVADLAVDRYKLATQTIRATRKAKKGA
jgi:hypothetical protein